MNALEDQVSQWRMKLLWKSDGQLKLKKFAKMSKFSEKAAIKILFLIEFILEWKSISADWVTKASIELSEHNQANAIGL